VGGRPRTSAIGPALRQRQLGGGSARREVLLVRGGARRGPRWNFTDTLAVEARAQVLSSSPSSDDRFWYREIALRYRPVKNVAVRMGYSEMDYRPANLSDGDSPVHVRMYGPFLGLDFPF